MAREPMWYAAAGVVFGFVLGYMAANAGDPQTAGVPQSFAGSAVGAPGLQAPSSAAAPAAAAPQGQPVGPLDPNEVKALEAYAAREPKNPGPRVELGNLYMDHERWDDAARWYREALALDPKDADVRTDLGACLVHAGKPAEAVPVFDEVLKTDPGHKKALFNKGIALMQSGQPKQAVALWEDLLKRYPDDPQLQGLRQQIESVRQQKAGS
jgi:cytochrome c-type biogenesis protein CcmH/NrfG